jgi:hypothetical protein
MFNGKEKLNRFRSYLLNRRWLSAGKQFQNPTAHLSPTFFFFEVLINRGMNSLHSMDQIVDETIEKMKAFPYKNSNYWTVYSMKQTKLNKSPRDRLVHLIGNSRYMYQDDMKCMNSHIELAYTEKGTFVGIYSSPESISDNNPTPSPESPSSQAGWNTLVQFLMASWICVKQFFHQ